MVKKPIITERVNLFEPNDVIAMKFTISGQVEISRMIAAFDAAVKANETLNSKIVLSETGDVWYEPVNVERNIMRSVDGDWMEVLEEQQKILFAIDQGEMLRGFLFSGEEKSQVLLLAHHLAGDGKALVYFIEQMMRALNGEALPYQCLRTIYPEEIPAKNQILLSIGLYLRYWNHRWKKCEKIFTMEDRCRIHQLYWNKNRMSMCHEHFSEKDLDCLHLKAKKANVSLTSYLIMAFAKQIPDKIGIGMAIDGRLDSNRNMGNQTSGTKIVFRYHVMQSFERNAQHFQKVLKRRLSSGWSKYFVLYFMGKLHGSFVDSIYMNLYGGFENDVSRRMAVICGYENTRPYYSFTNLTKLDIPYQYGTYQICEFIFVPPYISYGERMVGIATLDKEMNISYQVRADENTELEMDKFYRIMEELKK